MAMVSSKTKAVVVAGAGGAGAVTQLVAVKQLVDNTSSIKPLGNFSTPYAKGLNEWSTLASLIGGAVATGYVIYQMEKGESLSDISIAIGTYGITSLTGGVVNAFLDPLQSNFGVDLGKTLSNIPAQVSTAFSNLGKDLKSAVNSGVSGSSNAFIGRTVN